MNDLLLLDATCVLPPAGPVKNAPPQVLIVMTQS